MATRYVRARGEHIRGRLWRRNQVFYALFVRADTAPTLDKSG